MALWGTLVLGGLIALLALFYVIWPLLSKEVPPYLEQDDKLTELISRKDAVLKAIKDLEFDHQTGKVSKEDFERFDARLRRQAIAYIQQIEKVAPAVSQVEDQIEAEIARYRRTVASNTMASNTMAANTVAGTANSAPVNGLPAQKAAANGNGHQQSNGHQAKRFCTECGAPLEPSGKFCGQCGTPVTAEPASVS